MDLLNVTDFPAQLARAVLPYRDLMLATVVVKCSFHVSTDGRVALASSQTELQEADAVTPYGTVDGDMVPVKQGCDFAIMGSARPLPLGSAAGVHEIHLRLGSFERRWRLFGDRRWTRTPGGFQVSPPLPFTEMQLGYDKAYGGTARWQGRLEGACYENVEGMGFVVREEAVEDLPLPNLENAQELITAWQDRPMPAGLAPVPRKSTLRGSRGYRIDAAAGSAMMAPLAFCFSHPAMLLPVYPTGASFELTGMGFHERMAFEVPALSLRVRLELGGREHLLSLVPDTLCVFPDDGGFHVVARRALVYQFIPERIRRMTVEPGGAPHAGSYPTIRTARGDAASEVFIGPEDDATLLPFDELLRLNPMTELVESFPLCASG